MLFLIILTKLVPDNQLSHYYTKILKYSVECLGLKRLYFAL